MSKMKFNKLVLVISSIAVGYVNCSGESARLSVDQDFQNLVQTYKDLITTSKVTKGIHVASDDIAFVMASYPEIGSDFLTKLERIHDEVTWININNVCGTIARAIRKGDKPSVHVTRALQRQIDLVP